MSNNLIATISEPISKRLEETLSYFPMFIGLDTGPEDWFRVEILDSLAKLTEVEILATNQRFNDHPGRPDFVVKHDGEDKIIELKVLPTDRNYNSGYQRFCAGKTNKADFDALANGEICLIIYVHWPSSEDFLKTKANLEKRYNVSCHTTRQINFNGGVCSISFWQRKA